MLSFVNAHTAMCGLLLVWGAVIVALAWSAMAGVMALAYCRARRIAAAGDFEMIGFFAVSLLILISPLFILEFFK